MAPDSEKHPTQGSWQSQYQIVPHSFPSHLNIKAGSSVVAVIKMQIQHENQRGIKNEGDSVQPDSKAGKAVQCSPSTHIPLVVVWVLKRKIKIPTFLQCICFIYIFLFSTKYLFVFPERQNSVQYVFT